MCCVLLTTWPADAIVSGGTGPDTGATVETGGAMTPGTFCWQNNKTPSEVQQET
jgi:hypothetical protein